MGGFDAPYFVNVILGILGGLLAAAALIISKKPDAKQYIDKLAVYQALIGVGLVALCLINFLRAMDGFGMALKYAPVFGATLIAMLGAGFVLGALFGMPQIAKWIPGDSSAEQKAVELSKKVAPYQVMLGIILFVASLLQLLYQVKILKP
ncbi:MAG TPA: hypothetical protein VIV11_16170 [Kofleriaceae bacterium]